MTTPRDRRPPPRERVVLAQRRGARRVRSRVEVQEQTEIGDAFVRGLIRAQLGLALRVGGVAATALAALPVLFLLVPSIADVSVAGISLPWLILGVAVYPVLFAACRFYVRRADRNEQEFVDLVDD